MNSNEKKDKGIAIGGTILFHALAVLVLFLMAFKTPLPLPGEEGVEVDLGMMNQGMGNIQPDKPAVPMAAQPQQQPNKSKEDITTQNDDEAPALEKPKNTKPKQETKPAEQPQKPSVPGFTWHDSPQAGGSEGNTGQPGDQGDPNGLSNIHQYDGHGGSGNGIQYDLGGRGAKSLGHPKKDFLEEGVVCVEIWVNKEGVVIDAKISTKGTFTNNADLKERALQAARLSSFFADPNAPEKQRGTITYNFVFNQ
jgi:TonB family protein